MEVVHCIMNAYTIYRLFYDFLAPPNKKSLRQFNQTVIGKKI